MSPLEIPGSIFVSNASFNHSCSWGVLLSMLFIELPVSLVSYISFAPPQECWPIPDCHCKYLIMQEMMVISFKDWSVEVIGGGEGGGRERGGGGEREREAEVLSRWIEQSGLTFPIFIIYYCFIYCKTREIFRKLSSVTVQRGCMCIVCWMLFSWRRENLWNAPKLWYNNSNLCYSLTWELVTISDSKSENWFDTDGFLLDVLFIGTCKSQYCDAWSVNFWTFHKFSKLFIFFSS